MPILLESDVTIPCPKDHLPFSYLISLDIVFDDLYKHGDAARFSNGGRAEIEACAHEFGIHSKVRVGVIEARHQSFSFEINSLDLSIHLISLHKFLHAPKGSSVLDFASHHYRAFNYLFMSMIASSLFFLKERVHGEDIATIENESGGLSCFLDGTYYKNRSYKKQTVKAKSHLN